MASWDTSLLVSGPQVPDDPGMETFLWYIYRENIFTDVVFELETPDGPETFSAHKMVLAMWSPKFEDMFYREEEKNLVCLKDVKSQAFQDLLKFMYGCDPVLNSHKNASDLYKVAKKFDVSSLASSCEDFLFGMKIEVSNVFDLLDTAKYMQNEDMMNRCLHFIETQTCNVIKSFQVCDITPSMVEVILKSPRLSLDSEYTLILWIFSWAKNMYVDHHQYSSLREVLCNFLPRLDFLALSNTQFASICKCYDQFFNEDEALRIFMNIGIRNSRQMPDWYDANLKHRTYSGNDL